MANENQPQPFISADKKIPEFTFQAILLGSILGIVLAAANTYFGLYAGMTVSASIPSAVISMVILRGILRRGTILENNIVQTIGSSGESLAAGVIFTVPALVITESWHQFHFWPTTFIAMTGGLLGVLFMIPLRRALVIEEPGLKFPEGVACAEVLKAGEEGGKGGKAILYAIVVGGIYKFLSSGLTLLKGGLEVAWRSGQSVFYMGTETSLALLSVGYIVGLNIGTLIFLGGLIGWAIGIPIYTATHPMLEGEAMDIAWTVWSTQVRYMGVGAMAVSGLWTIYNCRVGIKKGIQKVFKGSSRGDEEVRTDSDLRRRFLIPMILLTTLFVFGLYKYLTTHTTVSVLATILMVIASFFFVAVASYIAGLVGTSNSPVSGMTICALLFSSSLLLLLGFKGTLGVIAVLGIAGVVCGAACSAGDICQDLKTGQLVGATPWKQQIAEIFGAIIPAFVLAPVLTILHGAYGIGVPVREGVKPLVAPQATLFSKLAEAFFLDKGELPWNMFWAGVLITILIILVDQFLKKRGSSFRLHSMAVAVGIYLPLQLSAPMFVGGLLNHWIHKRLAKKGRDTGMANHYGVLVASGLIAGESLMGVFVAGLIFSGFALPFNIGFSANEGIMALVYLATVLFFAQWVMKGSQKN